MRHAVIIGILLAVTLVLCSSLSVSAAEGSSSSSSSSSSKYLCPVCEDERVIHDRDPKCLEWEWIETDALGNPLRTSGNDPNGPHTDSAVVNGPEAIIETNAVAWIASAAVLAAVFAGFACIIGTVVVIVFFVLRNKNHKFNVMKQNASRMKAMAEEIILVTNQDYTEAASDYGDDNEYEYDDDDEDKTGYGEDAEDGEESDNELEREQNPELFSPHHMMSKHVEDEEDGEVVISAQATVLEADERRDEGVALFKDVDQVVNEDDEDDGYEMIPDQEQQPLTTTSTYDYDDDGFEEDIYDD